MTPYLNYLIAKEQQNEFIRQAQEYRYFDHQTRRSTQQIIRRVLTILDAPRRIVRKALHRARPQVVGHVDLQESLY